MDWWDKRNVNCIQLNKSSISFKEEKRRVQGLEKKKKSVIKAWALDDNWKVLLWNISKQNKERKRACKGEDRDNTAYSLRHKDMNLENFCYCQPKAEL